MFSREKNVFKRGKIEFISDEKKFNRNYFNLKLKYNVFYIYLLHDVAGFLKITISMH